MDILQYDLKLLFILLQKMIPAKNNWSHAANLQGNLHAMRIWSTQNWKLLQLENKHK